MIKDEGCWGNIEHSCNTLGERDGDGFTTLGLNCVNADDPR